MFQVEQNGHGLKETIRLVDTDSDSSVRIAPNFGFNAFSFVCRLGGRTVDLLHAPDAFPSPGDKATAFGTPILAPFPNRIRGGRFSFGGTAYSLPTNEHGKNAIHGFAVDQPWRVIGTGAEPAAGAWATGEFQLSRDRPDYLPLWPADFVLRFTYRLRGRTLATEIEVTNPDARPLPFGVGTHPYFRFPSDPGTALARCAIVVPAARQVELADYLPTGRLLPVTGDGDLRRGIELSRRTLDDVFTGLEAEADGRIRHRLRDQEANVELTISHGPEFPFAVVYTPPHRHSICIEPYTCVTDAINLAKRDFDPGPWILAPGEKRRLEILYEATPIADS